ncbi:hypothetical protein HGRIS_011983 [Hohenbuehelia grisea]|uniref:Uncharacterized protein n=1 Tax=Hohenbuehelia grisea TaxID=104357 RepID=A0ABR3JXM5_9AGAR
MQNVNGEFVTVRVSLIDLKSTCKMASSPRPSTPPMRLPPLSSGGDDTESQGSHGNKRKRTDTSSYLPHHILNRSATPPVRQDYSSEDGDCSSDSATSSRNLAKLDQHDNAPYNPKDEQPSVAETTPQKRVNKASSVAPSARSRARSTINRALPIKLSPAAKQDGFSQDSFYRNTNSV